LPDAGLGAVVRSGRAFPEINPGEKAMTPETVIAIYRPRPGKEEELAALLREHVPLLRDEGLATNRPVVLLRSRQDGSYLEIFEWASPEAMERAHRNPRVLALWEHFAGASEYLPFASLHEATALFPSFEAVDGLVE
jgi:hypothetical protein